MPRFELLQKSPQRHRRDSSVSEPGTFPESYYRRHGGDPDDDIEDMLEENAIIMADIADHDHEHGHAHDHEVTRRHLGHLGLETKRPE